MELIAKGQTVLGTKYTIQNMLMSPTYVSRGPFSEWRSQSLTMLRNFLPETHTYTEAFAKEVEQNYATHTHAGIGIFRAMLEDVKGGYLTGFKTLISSELFNDFLDMAAHLLENGYKEPAAMLTGAVLEDGLRRVVGNAGVQLRVREDIGSLNQKGVDANIYTRLVFRQVQVWTEIRNKADHGQFEEYALADVSNMHTGVSDFLANYLC